MITLEIGFGVFVGLGVFAGIVVLGVAGGLTIRNKLRNEIGRASCRERV